jgi:hypothetical protein
MNGLAVDPFEIDFSMSLKKCKKERNISGIGLDGVFGETPLRD